MNSTNNHSRVDTSRPDFTELLAGLHARSPAEIMGAAATSSLLGSTLWSTFGWLVGVLGITLVVALLGGGPVQTSKEVASPAAAAQSGANVPTAAQSSAAPADAGIASPQSPATGDTTVATGSADATASAAEAMGIDEASDSDADPKPLEDRLNQLLDGLE